MKKYRKMLSNWQAEPIIGLMRLIETQSKETVANWAAGYAEVNFLPIYAKHYPEDHRPQLALEYARKWLRKEVKLPEAKKYILGCHEAAGEAEGNPSAQAAARAIGQAASSIGQRGSEETIRKYVQEQGIEKEYRRLHYDEQLKLF
jgi:hypothetical protein